jgi:hypothetical protein
MLVSGFLLDQMDLCGLFHLNQRLYDLIPFHPLRDHRQIFPDLRKDALDLRFVLFCPCHMDHSRCHHSTERFAKKEISFDLFLPEQFPKAAWAHRLYRGVKPAMNACELTASITAAANAIAGELRVEELNFLGVVLTQLGDTLFTIATCRELCGPK